MLTGMVETELRSGREHGVLLSVPKTVQMAAD